MDFIRMLRLLAVCCVVASLTLPLATSAQVSDEEMFELMAALMGRGIEAPMDQPAPSGMATALSTSSSAYVDFSSIDFPGATATRAFGINPAGDIVGSYSVGAVTHGFLLTAGSFISIDVPGAVSTEAWGINPHGDVVGRYRNAGDPKTHGFVLAEGVFSDISVGSHLHTLPIKISPTREIVGCFHDTNFLQDMRGYAQRGNSVRTFNMLPSSMHNGVTPGGGVIAGISFESLTRVRGYVITKEVFSAFDFPGATFTQAWDVSPSGRVVGYYNAQDSHGFTLDAQGFNSIDVPVPGALWTRIFGINAAGDLVGSYADASNTVHGFLLRGRNER